MELRHVSNAFLLSDLQGEPSFLSFVNVTCKSYFHCCNVFEIKDGKSPSRTIKS